MQLMLTLYQLPDQPHPIASMSALLRRRDGLAASHGSLAQQIEQFGC
ncbi:hypothetical protein BH24ACT15_BH24ACT15_16810 [soil metagenome]|jgi:hypothetical protein